MNRRGEVIEYVTRKYGRDNVAQIITFGTMAAKAAIKDVGRAMDIPYADVDRIAKMVPTQLNITLDQAIADSPQLNEAYAKDPQVRELLDTAQRRRRVAFLVLGFAIAYNAAAICLALAARMNPLLAAVIMPASSLISLAIVVIGLGEGRQPFR